MKKLLSYCFISSVLMIALSVVFVSCQKDDDIVGDAQAIVRVVDKDGKILSNVEVKMYDEATYEKFKNNNRLEPNHSMQTNESGIATFNLNYDFWFASKKQRMFTFVVLEGHGKNYQFWAKGETFKPGKKVKIEIKKNPLEFPKRIK